MSILLNLAVQYIAQWFADVPPDELRAKAQRNEDLTAQLKTVETQVRIAKGLFRVQDIDPDDLLRQLLARSPAHGVVLTEHYTWYRRQIEDLKQYVASLA